MQRDVFLQMCQKCSALDFLNIPDDLLVICDGIKYIPFGYEIKFKKGQPIHNSILQDLNRNSLTYAPLTQVDKYLKV